MNTYFFKAVLLVASILMTSCTTVNHKVGSMLNLKTDLKLQILADYNANPDEQNKPSPVVVRLYELKSDRAFKQADFLDIYERDTTVLGGDLVGKHELDYLEPNTYREETLVLSEETKFVGIFAEFFHFENAKAAVVFPVTENNVIRNKIGFKVSGNRVSLVKIEKDEAKAKKGTKSYQIKGSN